MSYSFYVSKRQGDRGLCYRDSLRCTCFIKGGLVTFTHLALAWAQEGLGSIKGVTLAFIPFLYLSLMGDNSFF